MFKPCLLSLALVSSVAFAVDSLPVTPMMGDITKGQFMERAEQRFALQDKNGDGVLSVAEEAATWPGGRGDEAGRQARAGADESPQAEGDTSKAQFMTRQEDLRALGQERGRGDWRERAGRDQGQSGGKR